MNITYIICEGPHDTFFLFRLLKTVGYSNYLKKIKDYPTPVNNFILTNLKEQNYEELSLLNDLRSTLTPSICLISDDHLLMLY